MIETLPERMTTPQILARLLRDALQVLGWRVVATFLAMMGAGFFEGLGLTLLFPLMAKFGIGSAGTPNVIAEGVDRLLRVLNVPDTLGAIIFFVVVVLLLQVGCNLLRLWFLADNKSHYTESWQRRLFDAFSRANWSFFIRERNANRVNAVIAQATRVSDAFYIMMLMATSVVMMIVYISISLVAAWPVVIIMSALGIAIYVAVRPVARRGRVIGEQMTEVSRQLQHSTTEYLQSAKLIKATATEHLVSQMFAGVTDNYRRIFRQAQFNPGLIYAIYSGAGYVALGTGIWLAIGVLKFDSAAVIVSIYIFLRLYTQLTTLQQSMQTFALAAPALPDMLGQLREAEAASEEYNTGVEMKASGPASVEISSVHLSYGELAALDGVSLSIRAGSVVGVTGPSGAGKSTLVDIIIGLLTPRRGKVLIDGTPLAKFDLSSWRRCVGYVAQETILLNDTVAANISWGNASATREDIRRAAREANALEFIEKMPEALDTQVGERGVRLSGGQRQRLGLARALLGKKRLLILDEATSALDSEAEASVLAALDSLRGHVTILMIAHRLSTLAKADQIVFLENGRIAESGTWSQLTRRTGKFKQLWKRQNTHPREPASPGSADA